MPGRRKDDKKTENAFRFPVFPAKKKKLIHESFKN
jgi:hypothetical protein